MQLNRFFDRFGHVNNYAGHMLKVSHKQEECLLWKQKYGTMHAQPLDGSNYCNPGDDNTCKSETVGFITIIFLVCSLVYYFNYCKYCNKQKCTFKSQQPTCI